MEHMMVWNVINSLLIVYGLVTIYKNRLDNDKALSTLEEKMKKVSPRMRK